MFSTSVINLKRMLWLLPKGYSQKRSPSIFPLFMSLCFTLEPQCRIVQQSFPRVIENTVSGSSTNTFLKKKMPQTIDQVLDFHPHFCTKVYLCNFFFLFITLCHSCHVKLVSHVQYTMYVLPHSPPIRYVGFFTLLHFICPYLKRLVYSGVCMKIRN